LEREVGDGIVNYPELRRGHLAKAVVILTPHRGTEFQAIDARDTRGGRNERNIQLGVGKPGPFIATVRTAGNIRYSQEFIFSSACPDCQARISSPNRK